MEAIGIQLRGEYEGDHQFGQMKIYEQCVLAHGKGKVKYHNQSKYTGEFKNGKKHGEGELVFSEASLHLYFRKKKKEKHFKNGEDKIVVEKRYQG